MTSRAAATAMRPTPEAAAARSSPPVTGTGSMRGLAGELADVAAGVPGVARLTAVLGSRPVRVDDHDDPSGRHIEVHLAVGPGHHPLKVARAVREAVAEAALNPRGRRSASPVLPRCETSLAGNPHAERDVVPLRARCVSATAKAHPCLWAGLSNSRGGA